MARCEDFPCCGHEPGCCPDFHPVTGRQLNMKCVCGATLPLNSRYSICDGCMVDPDDPDQFLSQGPEEDEYDDDDDDDDEDDFDDDDDGFGGSEDFEDQGL